MQTSTMHASTMHPCTIFYLTTLWTRVSRSELGIIAERPSELASAGRLDVISNMERARASIITAITAVTGTSPSPPLPSPLLIISITTFGNPLFFFFFSSVLNALRRHRSGSQAQRSSWCSGAWRSSTAYLRRTHHLPLYSPPRHHWCSTLPG